MHPDDLPRIMVNNTELHSQHKKLHVAPYRFRHADGRWLWIESVVTNQLDHPDIRGVVVSARDITHQYHTQMKLKEMQLIEALVEGEEKERSRIARDLHDGVASIIAGAKMQLTALAEQVEEVQERKEFKQSISLLDNAAAQVRNTSHNLMPEVLLEKGLDGALLRYCQSISSNKLQFTYASVGEAKRFTPNFELSLYRIIQELIGNIMKHSGASTALVQRSFRDKLLSFTIEDNGKGFNTHQQGKGTGLQSIQKRVRSMNGTIDLSSEPGKGTSIYLEFEM
jgi:signal transduction histidine kinase